MQVKAMVYERYGPPEVIGEVRKPTPKAEELVGEIFTKST